MRKKFFIAAIVIAVAGAAGCGKKADEGAKQTRLKIEEPDANQGFNSSGRAEAPLIDPGKKTVLVLAAPSAPKLVDQERAKLAGEHGKVEETIHGLMGDYANNLRNAKSRAKYQEQIAQQLEIYKRQSLQLYKLQQQAELAKASGP